MSGAGIVLSFYKHMENVGRETITVNKHLAHYEKNQTYFLLVTGHLM